MPDLLTPHKSTGKFNLPPQCKKFCGNNPHCYVDTATYQTELFHAVQNLPKDQHSAAQKCLEQKYCTNKSNVMLKECRTN